MASVADLPVNCSCSRYCPAGKRRHCQSDTANSSTLRRWLWLCLSKAESLVAEEIAISVRVCITDSGMLSGFSLRRNNFPYANACGDYLMIGVCTSSVSSDFQKSINALMPSDGRAVELLICAPQGAGRYSVRLPTPGNIVRRKSLGWRGSSGSCQGVLPITQCIPP